MSVTATATVTWARVSIDSFHMPSIPIAVSAAPMPSPRRTPRAARPSTTPMPIMTGHGMSEANSSRSGVTRLSVTKSLKGPVPIPESAMS